MRELPARIWISESTGSVSMPLALMKVGQDENFEGVDLFQALVVGDEKGGFALDCRRDLQSVRQANRRGAPAPGPRLRRASRRWRT